MNSRINPKLWRKARVKALDRDGWKCVKCGRRGRGNGLQVDHIIGLMKGGKPYALENLQTLCAFPCHWQKTHDECYPTDPERTAWDGLLMQMVADGV